MILPAAIVYAGLAGVLLALLVATATNGWQCRVFVLLALRLAIGWHFLFEGLHKLHSFEVGVTDSNRVFTSEPYFAAAEGPLGEYMRKKYLGDPEGTYIERLTKEKPVSAAEFKKLSPEAQADLCPKAVAEFFPAALARAKEQTEKDKARAEADKAAAEKAEKPESAAAAAAKIAAADKLLERLAAVTPEKFAPAKAKFAAWVYGAETREAKVHMVTGDIPMTAEQRLSAVAVLQRDYDALAARDAEGMGRGYGYEMERKKKLKTDLLKAKTDLAADTDKYLTESLKELEVPVPPADKPIKWLDNMTAYTITAVGAGLLLGLFTKLWCLVGVGFLAMTYAAHPTVPWMSLPPNTEGNPLFINKNLIEALAMLVVVVHPTGRWLGLDALLCRLILGNKPADASPTPPAA